jgi:heme/copper-type cytochrome/quinol oxidase subunit 2
MNRKKILALALLAAVVIPAVLAACPLCKEATPANNSGMWRGMYWSILLMMAMPFAAAATLIAVIRRARRRQAPPQGAQP